MHLNGIEYCGYNSLIVGEVIQYGMVVSNTQDA